MTRETNGGVTQILCPSTVMRRNMENGINTMQPRVKVSLTTLIMTGNATDLSNKFENEIQPA